MKDQILKIAKVKSEKEFYKKYPSEEAFMKAHKKEFKKAAMGAKMVNKQLHQLTDFSNHKAQGGWASAGVPGLSTATYDSSTGLVNNASGVVSKSDTDALGFADKAPGSAAGFDWGGAGMSAAGAVPGIINGINAINQQKKNIKSAEQQSLVTGVQAQAAESRDISKPQHRYVRPEDMTIQPGQLGNPMGTGTNYLAQYGTRIGGNPTEIQNTYNPGNLYNDLGYEPLNDSNPKQFRRGGYLPIAEFGEYFQDSGQAQVADATLGAAEDMFVPGLGKALSPLNKAVGNLFGGVDDARKLKGYQDTTTQNQGRIGMQQQLQNGQFSASREDGGRVGDEYKWVSHTWQPQVIASFGEHKVSDLLKPPHDADMLRAGGHLKEYTPPSAAAMYTGRPGMPHMEGGGRMNSTNMMFDTDRYPRAQYGTQMAMGGDLQVHEGEAETISHNPYLPNGGETVMFRGPSHANGGMDISYGQSGVEVQGGEPAVKLQDGGTPGGNLVVYGGMPVSKTVANDIGLPKDAGRKYQNVAADISKVEAKQGRVLDKATDLIENSDTNDKFAKLSMNSGLAMQIGANMKYKQTAQQKMDLAAHQNAILDTAKEHSLEADALAKGKIKPMKQSDMAKFGKKLSKAQDGKSVYQYNGRFLDPNDPKDAALIKSNMDDVNSSDAQIKAHFANKQQGISPIDMSKFQAPQVAALPKEQVPTEYNPNAIQPVSGSGIGAQAVGMNQPSFFTPYDATNEVHNLPDVVVPSVKSTKFNEWPDLPTYSMSAINQEQSNSSNFGNKGLDALRKTGNALKTAGKFIGKGLQTYGPTALSIAEPYLRPINKLPLDPNELSAENYALSNNQIDPVRAQSYQPMLQGQPSRISLQDQINTIDSQANAAIRAAGSNPAAQAQIFAQVADAKSKVLGEQFRMNQGAADQTTAANRATLNDAQLKNLGIYDAQQTKEAQAKSNTKATTIAALQSINDKTIKNKLENQMYAVEQQRNNYRVDSEGRPINYNYAQFNVPQVGSMAANTKTDASGNSLLPVYNKDGSIKGYTVEKAKAGAKIKARNGSIVKALKTL